MIYGFSSDSLSFCGEFTFICMWYKFDNKLVPRRTYPRPFQSC